MNLPLAVDFRLRLLADPRRVLWSESGLSLTPGQRRELCAKQRLRVAQSTGLAVPTMPLEQLDMLLQFTLRPENDLGGLGLISEALDFLATRYLHPASPVLESELLGEFQAVKLQVVPEHLACWQVAKGLAGAAAGHGAPRRGSLGWTAGLPIDRHHLAQRLEEPLVEGHVHLGGVLGSLDLWGEVLDPRLRRRRCRQSKSPLLRLGDYPLRRRVLERLNQASILRDLLHLELVRLGALPGIHRDRLLARAVTWLNHQATVEEVLVGEAGQSPEWLSHALALSDAEPIPFALSPTAALCKRRATHLDHLLGAERELLVNSFLALSGRFGGQPSRWFGAVLGVYLTCQGFFHREVTQQWQRVGLGNFVQWYDSPSRWFQDNDDPLRQQQILARVSRGFRDRVEGRVTPKLQSIRSWIRAFENRGGGKDQRLGRDFGLVVHFIKAPDPRSRGRMQRPVIGRPGPANLGWRGESVPTGERTRVDDPPWLLRHAKLRQRLRHQCYDLERARNGDPELAWAVLGIDAARKETDTPPEVLAPAFRYLRRRQPGAAVGVTDGSDRGAVPPLRASYHVGESFNEPITGLRRTHEAMRFLDLRPGDRLGHALVLGIDPKRWIESCGAPPFLTREQWLDNLVWIAWMLSEHKLEHLKPTKLDEWIASEVDEIYEPGWNPSPRPLQQLLAFAWQLRWMDPIELFGVLERIGLPEGRRPESESPCRSQSLSHPLGGCLHSCRQVGRCLVDRGKAKTSLCRACRDGEWVRSPMVFDLSLSPRRLEWRRATLDLDHLLGGNLPVAALHFLWKYHFDRQVFDRGRATSPCEGEYFELLELFEVLRRAVLDEVARRDLTVEACPTSNQVIGGFGGLENHPIFRFDTQGLGEGNDPPIRVTVNTDDPGVFSTSLPGEYAVLGWAAEQHGKTPAEIERWLMHLRDAGFQSTFLRHEGLVPRPVLDSCWPPNMALYPEWEGAAWRQLALAPKRRKARERGVARLRRFLLDEN